MNKSELTKEYNKRYYAENKERISAMLSEKFCVRIVVELLIIKIYISTNQQNYA